MESCIVKSTSTEKKRVLVMHEKCRKLKQFTPDKGLEIIQLKTFVFYSCTNWIVLETLLNILLITQNVFLQSSKDSHEALPLRKA